MTKIKYSKISSSVTTPLEETQRTEVRISHAPECWNFQHYRPVLAFAGGSSYYTTTTLTGEPSGGSAAVEYLLLVNFVGTPYVMVRVNFSVEPGFSVDDPAPAAPETNPIDAKKMATAIARAQSTARAFCTAVNNTWQNRFLIEITDPACGVRTVPIRYEAVMVEKRPHYIIKAYKALEREMLSGQTLSLSAATKHNTYVHEFAHCIGLPDEYSTIEGVMLKVNYLKPDGTKGDDILCYPAPTPPPSGHRLMTTGVPLFLERHAWPVAIETQQLLSQKLGRQITCRILLV